MRVAGVIVAGGLSTRMGIEKANLMVGKRTLLERAIDCIGPQVTALVINANGDQKRFKRCGLPVVSDIVISVKTPLAGLHAGLNWAREAGCEAVLTVPTDCPFMPRDLLEKLTSAGFAAAIAASGGERHYLTGLWSVSLLEDLQEAIVERGVVRVKDWAARSGATAVSWEVLPFDPFMNVNTPEELAEANRIAAEFDI